MLCMKVRAWRDFVVILGGLRKRLTVPLRISLVRRIESTVEGSVKLWPRVYVGIFIYYVGGGGSFLLACLHARHTALEHDVASSTLSLVGPILKRKNIGAKSCLRAYRASLWHVKLILCQCVCVLFLRIFFVAL